MAKICFPNPVNYNGVDYAPGVPFVVKDSEVEELRKKGGWLIQETKKKTTNVKK